MDPRIGPGSEAAQRTPRRGRAGAGAWASVGVGVGVRVGTTLLGCLGLVACGGSPPPVETPRARLPEIVLEPLPEPLRVAHDAARRAPTLDSFEAVSRALDAGHYAAVEAALDRARAAPGSLGAESGSLGDARLACIAARHRFAVARYDDVRAFARACAADAEDAEDAEDAAVRIAAQTLEAEADLARGRLASAGETLAALESEPGAHRALLLHARLLERTGRPDEARVRYHRLVAAYNDDVIGRSDADGLAYVASAAARLGAIRDANQAFAEATRADRARVETQREWAALFASKRDYGHAEESLLEALARNPDDPRTLVAIARLRIERDYDFDAAHAPLVRALAVAPSLVEAHVLAGALALFDQDFDAATASVARARATDPTSLDAATLAAAIAFVRVDAEGFARERDAVFAIDPTHGSFYTALSVFAEWEHRYPDMVAFARQALALDRDDAAAWSLLGLQLLHEGEEPEALEALRQAWSRDRYDVAVFNTLNLYERVIAPDYVQFEDGPFLFRTIRAERVVLEEPLPRILGEGYAAMVAHYGFTPEGPLRFELFATAEHFSVRTAGLPNIGVQGVCFGKVVTAMSPSSGSFDWAAITWHELAHVFHIQLSGNHVPRWLTEGLAEYETRLARPEWRRELEHVLVAALESEALPPMARMNEAFTHARSAEDSVAAYHASSEIAAYLVERFGFAKIAELLRGFRDEVRFEVLAERVLGVTSVALDADFRRLVLERNATTRSEARLDFGRYRDGAACAAYAAAHPHDAGALAARAASELVAGRREAAVETAERALALDAAEPLAHFVRARVRLEARAPEAEVDLLAIAERGRGSYAARMLLARLAHARGADDQAIHHLEAAFTFDPARPEALGALVDLTRDGPDELGWLERFVAVEEHDREAFERFIGQLDAAHATARIAALEERIERLDPMNEELRLVLAAALETEGRGAAAERHRGIARGARLLRSRGSP